MKLLRLLAAERVLAHSARVESGEALLRRLLARLDAALAPTPPAFDAGTSRAVLDKATSVAVSFTRTFED